MSDLLAPELSCGRLAASAFKAIMVAVARGEAARLECCALMERVSQTPGPLAGERGERLMGAAWRLLAEHGRGAAPPADPTYLTGCRLDPGDVGQVQAILDAMRRQQIVPPGPDSLTSLIRQHAPDVQPGALALAETEQAFYRGMAAACLHTTPRWTSTLADDIAQAFQERPRLGGNEPSMRAAAIASPRGSDAAAASPLPRPDDCSAARLQGLVSPVAPFEPDVPTISALAFRFCSRKTQLGEWTDKTAQQMTQTAALLVKVVGHDHVTGLTQAEMGRYVDVLLALPKAYGKSPRDAACTVEELLQRGADLRPEQCGLSGATINRHLTQIGELLAYAASQGVSPAASVALKGLRARKSTRDREARAPFTRGDLVEIFSQPVWHSCVSERRRSQPGVWTFHDALYWAPLIAHYALMRREEICGLMVADVTIDGEVPHFIIRESTYRRLKTVQSRRRVPIHPELLRLGLTNYVGAVAALGYDLLFPELLPATGSTVLGDQLQDDWSKILLAAIPGARSARKCFHSFRHSGNQELAEARIPLEWRQDILGHGGASETEERYRSETGLVNKLVAIQALPPTT